ncbi:hypothetical protein EMCRGX_G007344 [Ephydatia muelleri]
MTDFSPTSTATHDLRGEQGPNHRSIVPHRSRKVLGAAQLPVGIYCVSTTWTCTQSRTSHMTSQNPSVHGLDFTSNQAQDVISDQLEELYLTTKMYVLLLPGFPGALEVPRVSFMVCLHDPECQGIPGYPEILGPCSSTGWARGTFVGVFLADVLVSSAIMTTPTSLEEYRLMATSILWGHNPLSR